MKNPVISVIVPVYNMQRCIHRCVDSLLVQTFTDFEVILVDDGSTDGSGIICDEYARKNSRVHVFHKPNEGASSARNFGINNARGEWITFCDADDYVFPNWLENYSLDFTDGVQLIQQGADADHDEFYYHGNPSARCGFEYQGGPVGYILNLFQARMTGYSWVKAFRTDIIRNNNLLFDKRIRLKEDEIFLLRYLPFVSVVKSFDRQGYFYFVPDWGNKYVLGGRETISFKNAYCDAILDLVNVCGYDSKLAFYFNSMVDEQMKIFAYSTKVEYFSRIRNLIHKCYDDCNLFYTLKWLVHNDRTSILSYPALLAHSFLRRFLNK